MKMHYDDKDFILIANNLEFHESPKHVEVEDHFLG